MQLDPTHAIPPETLVRGLGWFSVGLGLSELLAPRRVETASGTHASTALLRVYGLRELGVGIALLKSEDPVPWLWARVGGDVLDLATLLLARKGSRPRLKGSVLGIAAITAFDIAAAMSLSRTDEHSSDAVREELKAQPAPV